MSRKLQSVDDIVQRILLADPKVKDVLIADSTGTLISYMTRRVGAVSPFEELAAVSGSVLAELETLGSMLGLGMPVEDLREYENGVFLYHPIEDIAIVLVIGDRGLNLGLLRTMLQKYVPEIKRILSEHGIGIYAPDMQELPKEEADKLSAYISTIEKLDISFRGSFLFGLQND